MIAKLRVMLLRESSDAGDVVTGNFTPEGPSYVLSHASKRRWVIKTNTRLSKDDCDPNHKPDFHRCYRGIVGSLGYLVTVTHPDLAWSYSEFSKFFQLPGIAHMEATEHVLQYLRDTWNESITYTRGSRIPNELWGWVHTDWADDTNTRRPHTGYILMMNGGPISCPRKSRRQA